jgi:MFS family permease
MRDTDRLTCVEQVKSFHITENEDEIGYYVGMIASSLFFGRFLGSYVWGILSDRYGRRPILIFCSAAIATFTLGFGFSTDMSTAIGTRFATGLVHGIVGTVKASLAEISDGSNQSTAMSTVSSAWGIALVIGPGLGGVLYDPAGQYPNSFSHDSAFAKYPVLLPALIVSILCYSSALIVCLAMPETLRAKSPPTTREQAGVLEDSDTEAGEETKRATTARDAFGSAAVDDDEEKQVGFELASMSVSEEDEDDLLEDPRRRSRRKFFRKSGRSGGYMALGQAAAGRVTWSLSGCCSWTRRVYERWVMIAVADVIACSLCLRAAGPNGKACCCSC